MGQRAQCVNWGVKKISFKLSKKTFQIGALKKFYGCF